MDALSAENAYMFRHALLQQAAYDLMLPSDRATMHRHALELLERESSALPGELAAHALCAQHDVPQDQLALLKARRRKHLRAAIDLAQTQFRHAECIGFSHLYLETAEPDARERIDETCRMAEVLYRMGRSKDALDAAKNAVRLATELGDPLMLAQAQIALGTACMDSAEHAHAGQYMRVGVEGLRKLGATQPLPRALARLSSAVWLSGRPAEALPIAEEAAALSEQTGAEAIALSAKLNVINILSALGRGDEAMAKARALEPEAEHIRDPSRLCTLATTLGITYDFAGDKDRAEHYYTLARDASQQAGLLPELARALTNLGGVHFSRARYSLAMQCHTQSEQIAREIGDTRILWYALRGNACTFEKTEDFRSALERNLAAVRVAEAARLDEQAWESRVWAAIDFLQIGQAQDAVEILERAKEVTFDNVRARRHLALGQAALARAYARLAQVKEARVALNIAQEMTAQSKLPEHEEFVRWMQLAQTEVSQAEDA